MKIKEITNKNEWELFFSKQKEKTFLQSWNWAEFQKKQGNEVLRLGIYSKDSALIALAMAVKIKSKRGRFIFVPHGPVGSLDCFGVLSAQLQRIAEKEKFHFIRIAPIWEKSNASRAVFENLKYLEAPIHMHPEITLELDLSGSEQELLKAMRKTTRYLIRQAIKNKDIEIIKSRDLKDVDVFYSLYKETALRHKFVPFSLKYLIDEFNSFIDDNQILIFLGKYKSRVVASAMIVYLEDTAFYHQGASLTERRAPVPYLLQWEAIKEAKQRGCRAYNFWGIAPDIQSKAGLKTTKFQTAQKEKEQAKHPWAGLSLFKMGFGGEIKQYAKTQDMPVSKMYSFIRLFEKIRKRKRGL